MLCSLASTPLLWTALLLGSAFSVGNVAAEGLNVYGQALQKCSTHGMALAGWTRSGFCEDYDADSGSHNVCIDIPSSKGGNFCTVTGQPNWCDVDKPCAGNDKNGEMCPVENWCVCEWAFASYVEKAGGCNKVAEIICDSTNQKTLLHYEQAVSKGDTKAKNALDCLKSKCQLS